MEFEAILGRHLELVVLVVLLDHIAGEGGALRLTFEGESVLGLAVGRLVHFKPLVDAFQGSGEMLFDVVDWGEIDHSVRTKVDTAEHRLSHPSEQTAAAN